MPRCPLRNACVRPAWFNGAFRSRSRSEARTRARARAIDTCQHYLSEPPLSRASSLPQLIFSRHKTHVHHKTCGSELAREEACTFNKFIGCDTAFASRLALTGETRSHQNQVGYKAASGRVLISGTPSLGEVPSGGTEAFWLLLRFSKATRCKSGTISSRYLNNGYTHHHHHHHHHRLMQLRR